MTTKDVRVTVGIPTYNRSNFLRESIESVLRQSYCDFRLLICDNASEDATQETVASFDDPRIEYVRSDENIGMIANCNRVVELTRTEFLVLLPDDDLLYPDHLRCAVDVLDRHPSVGVVHTAFDQIDDASRVVEHATALVTARGALTIESGDDFLKRSMRSSWTVCFPSALYRTSAVADAEGLRANELPLADFPMFMRIACRWDFAFLSSTLAAVCLHADAATAALGSYTRGGYDLLDSHAKILFDHRQRFLDEVALPERQAAHYRRIAEDTFRREAVGALATRAGLGAPWPSTSRSLVQLVRAHPRTLLLPRAWRLGAAQLGCRFARRSFRRIFRMPT